VGRRLSKADHDADKDTIEARQFERIDDPTSIYYWSGHVFVAREDSITFSGEHQHKVVQAYTTYFLAHSMPSKSMRKPSSMRRHAGQRPRRSSEDQGRRTRRRHAKNDDNHSQAQAQHANDVADAEKLYRQAIASFQSTLAGERADADTPLPIPTPTICIPSSSRTPAATAGS